ncbi:5-exo-hydroxycamphor dehydrogenase [Lepidopterella palustris CBS 459.81]|uniref:5-exo-hydroxycamphor dehydrogenase n=1 Tax=Lepidopterella palustris CBS 459.81 TaxID=1314670 RepID=A0A8E2DZA1_9PEZI|nr:5-exo-hydroxycamphor dehydrogenase [Lepidopterella palustris CBS 459.81]
MRSGKVALFSGPGRPVKIVEEEIGKPASDEILVRVSMAGICGSDVHRLKGDIPFNSEAVCFGHEAVGVIESLGAEVKTDSVGTPLAEGDMLYWMPLAPCGTCWECSNSRSLHCKDLNWPPPPGKPNGAGFRQYATLKKKCIYIRLPPMLAPENVIALGCALPTALRGFKQLGSISPQADVVIQGSGPVGLACTLLASLAGVRSVIVIGDPAHRLEVACSLGATHTMSVANTTAKMRSEQVKLLTSGLGASIVVEAAGTADAFPQGLDLLGMNGRYLIMGLYSGEALCSINPVRICSLNLHIIGSLGIDVNSFQATVDIASKHGHRLRFADLITHRFPLDQLQEALVLAGQGVTIKAVIVPN